MESLANPGGIVVDLEAVAKVAHEAGIPLIVDNTLATPYLCRPFEWGADLIVHSTTKFLDGHGNSLGGMVVEIGKFDWSQGGKFPALTEPEPAYHGLRFYENFGDFAFTTKARAVALRDYGPTHGADECVPDHHRHRDAACAHGAALRQCAEGGGVPGAASARWPGCRTPAWSRARTARWRANTCRAAPARCSPSACAAATRPASRLVESVRLFSHLANIGDTRSLILHPASTTHRQLTRRAAAGRRRGAGCDPAVDRTGDGGRSDRRSRSGAGGGGLKRRRQTCRRRRTSAIAPSPLASNISDAGSGTSRSIAPSPPFTI